MNEEIVIKNIARSIYMNQTFRDRSWDLTNYGGCEEMASEIFDLIKKNLIPYQREIKINEINNG
jgi:hypothetical protein